MTKRLMDGAYIVCLRNRGKFTKRQMDVAKDYFLMGLSMRKIAEQRRWSVYRVRQTVMKIRSVMQNSE
jgi:predicted DNA-binding protein YlxM (UPF0122 family)